MSRVERVVALSCTIYVDAHSAAIRIGKWIAHGPAYLKCCIELWVIRGMVRFAAFLARNGWLS